MLAGGSGKYHNHIGETGETGEAVSLLGFLDFSNQMVTTGRWWESLERKKSNCCGITIIVEQ